MLRKIRAQQRLLDGELRELRAGEVRLAYTQYDLGSIQQNTSMFGRCLSRANLLDRFVECLHRATSDGKYY